MRNDGFDPSQIDVSSGIVTIELGQIDYTSEDTGEHINPYVLNVLGKTIKARAGQFVQGVLLVQVLDGEMLKVEAFPEHTLSNAPVDFTQEAIIYER